MSLGCDKIQVNKQPGRINSQSDRISKQADTNLEQIQRQISPGLRARSNGNNVARSNVQVRGQICSTPAGMPKRAPHSVSAVASDSSDCDSDSESAGLDAYGRPTEDATLLAVCEKWDALAATRRLTPMEEAQKEAEIATAAVCVKARERAQLKRQRLQRRRFDVEPEAVEALPLHAESRDRDRRRLRRSHDVGAVAVRVRDHHNYNSRPAASNNSLQYPVDASSDSDIEIISKTTTATTRTTTYQNSAATLLTTFFEPLPHDADYRDAPNFNLMHTKPKKLNMQHLQPRVVSDGKDREYRAAAEILIDTSQLLMRAQRSNHSTTRVRLELLKFMAGVTDEAPYSLSHGREML